ncbi:MAG: hypothetical protein M3082_10095 [Candidatus Dormibacteraeota bacterium]|nr:hypothetical protein [Candidatus Dormibacteraeota bacterium]
MSTPLGWGLFLVNVLALVAAPSIAEAATLGCGGAVSIIASPSPGKVGNNLSSVVSLSASDAWAVGGASSAVGNPPTLQSKPLAIHWNGSSWRASHSTLAGAGNLSGITAVSSRDIWAVGHQGSFQAGTPLAEHWNGSAWSVVPSPSIQQGYLLGASAHGTNDVWAVGIRLGTVSYSLIEHWDGSSWQVVPSPNPGIDYNEIDSVVAISSRLAWAVGFSISNNVSTPILARWNGVSWNLVQSPATGVSDNLLRSVAGLSENDVWAVGQSRSADGSSVGTLVEHWDGRGWRVVASPSPTPQAWLTGVAVAGGRVWAVGVRMDGFTNHTLIVRGEKGLLSAVPSPNRGSGDNMLEGVAVADGKAWAVGSDQGLTNGESLVLRACAV